MQIGAGFLNLVLLAPIAMQLVHLLMADLVWISLVLLVAAALAEGVPQIEMIEDRTLKIEGGVPQSSIFYPPSSIAGLEAATWKDYLALTKPRVISLLLFTTLTAMIIAAGGWPGMGLFLATGVRAVHGCRRCQCHQHGT